MCGVLLTWKDITCMSFPHIRQQQLAPGHVLLVSRFSNLAYVTLLREYISIYLWLYCPWLGPRLLFSFVIFFYTPGRSHWTSDELVARPLPTHRTTQTQTYMPRVGFEPTIPAFEQAKTVDFLDRAATVIDSENIYFSFGSTAQFRPWPPS
jgi:hypothetical protein